MWKLLFESTQGTSHMQTGQPCQDYCNGAVVGTTIVAACADGAGSANLSQLGSKAAVERFMEVVTSVESPPTKELIESWVDAARASVIEQAEMNETTPRQLACTFLAAVVSETWAAFAQIGDGVIVFDGTEGYELAFWPDNGEYANTTRFLTEDDYRENLRIEIVECQVTDLAILTDGLQMLALDFTQAKVHNPFFTPLFRTLRDTPDVERLQPSLREFLNSKRVNDRTDDDKTLLLATRDHVALSIPDTIA